MAKKKDVTRVATHPLDIEELACVITGLDYDEIEADTEIIEEALYEEFNTDLGQLQEIVCRLLPLINVGSSHITKEFSKGFSYPNRKVWIIKTPIKHNGNE